VQLQVVSLERHWPAQWRTPSARSWTSCTSPPPPPPPAGVSSQRLVHFSHSPLFQSFVPLVAGADPVGLGRVVSDLLNKCLSEARQDRYREQRTATARQQQRLIGFFFFLYICIGSSLLSLLSLQSSADCDEGDQGWVSLCKGAGG
jgi:hypothetical protein